MQAGAATSNEGCGGQSRLPLAVMAARLRRLRRGLPAVAAVMVEAGRMHVTEMVCRPAAWLTATRAMRPLSIQRSYNNKKSAAEMDGVVAWGWLVLPPQVATPPLTTLG